MRRVYHLSDVVTIWSMKLTFCPAPKADDDSRLYYSVHVTLATGKKKKTLEIYTKGMRVEGCLEVSLVNAKCTCS